MQESRHFYKIRSPILRKNIAGNVLFCLEAFAGRIVPDNHFACYPRLFVAPSQTTMILSYDGPKPSSVTIQSTSVSSNPATTWTPDEYGSFNFSGNKCDNIKATGMIKYGSIYKHKYEMVGWCSKNSSGIVDDGKITGFHAI